MQASGMAQGIEPSYASGVCCAVYQTGELHAQDVTNRLDLTPVAIMEGMAFAMTVFGDKPTACIHEKVLCLPCLSLQLRPTVHSTPICADN